MGQRAKRLYDERFGFERSLLQYDQLPAKHPMILLLCFDLRRRGGIERLSLQVRDALERHGTTVKVISTRRLGPGSSRTLAWSLRLCAAVALVAAQGSTGAEHACAAAETCLWLHNQRLSCWLHGLEVWGTLETTTLSS